MFFHQFAASSPLICLLKHDRTLTENPRIPVHRNIAAIPLPVEFPTICCSITAKPVSDCRNGSKT